jgi:hypothetical protein
MLGLVALLVARLLTRLWFSVEVSAARRHRVEGRSRSSHQLNKFAAMSLAILIIAGEERAFEANGPRRPRVGEVRHSRPDIAPLTQEQLSCFRRSVLALSSFGPWTRLETVQLVSLRLNV